MNNKKQTIEEILKDWGKKHQIFPSRNDALKNEIIGQHKSSPSLARVRRPVPRFALAFAGLAVLVLIVQQVYVEPPVKLLLTGGSFAGNVPPSSISDDSVLRTQSPDSGLQLKPLSERRISDPEFYPYQQEIPIKDSREFLKTDYHATIQSRDVSELSRNIELTVRGFKGRIDGSSISEKSAYITFAVPAESFDAFKNQVKSLVSARFIVESTSSTNMLPQKQSIEQSQEEYNEQLKRLRSDRSIIIANHKRAVAALEERLKVTTGDEERAVITSQITAENRTYSRKLSETDTQIKFANESLASLAKQDKNVIDTVATVRGTINIQWISIWEVLDLYFGEYWLVIALAIIAILGYIYSRVSGPDQVFSV